MFRVGRAVAVSARPIDAPPESSGAGDLEERVAAVVGSVLGISSPGRDENLFDLGGTSLHAVRIHRVLSRDLAPDLAVVDVFRHPTISSLARFLSGSAASGEPVQRGEDRAALRRELMARRRGEA